jgi:hypothetical protein
MHEPPSKCIALAILLVTKRKIHDVQDSQKHFYCGVTPTLLAGSALEQDYTPGTLASYNNESMPQPERVTIVAATEPFGKRRWTIRTTDGRVFDTYSEQLTAINSAVPKLSSAPTPTQSAASPRDVALSALIRHYTHTERTNNYSMYHQAQGIGLKLLRMSQPQAHRPVVASAEMAAGSPVYRFEANYRTCFVDQHDAHRRGSTRAFNYVDQTFELFRGKDGQWRLERMTHAAPTEIRPSSL